MLTEAYKMFFNETGRWTQGADLVDASPENLNRIGGLPNKNDYADDIIEQIEQVKSQMSLLIQLKVDDERLLQVFTTPLDNTPFKYKAILSPIQSVLPKYDDGYLFGGITTESLGYGLELFPTKVYMPMSNSGFETVAKRIITKRCDEEPGRVRLQSLYDGFCDYLPKAPCITVLGGYPDFVQDDPRGEEGNSETKCLFKIDSAYDFRRIKIGDAGIINGYYTKDDFSDLKIVWDCL